jgi:PKD repeat protein
MAWFDFWPSPASPGQWVYFTDMSLGATAWSLSFGDATPIIPARSFYHKYAGAGNYIAYQQVTGPAGTDATTKTVPVEAPPCSGPIMLLLLDS